MLAWWIAALSLWVGPESDRQELPSAVKCDQGAREVEKSLLRTRLNQEMLNAFEEIAHSRADRDLEVLPGLPGCASVVAAALELDQDALSRCLLRRHKIESVDYIKIGWAAILAVDPDALVSKSQLDPALLRENAILVRKRPRLLGLIFGK